MIEKETWFVNQTENVLAVRTENKTIEDIAYFEEKRRWVQDRIQRGLITPFEYEEEAEIPIITDFAYSNINPLFSERVVKRIDRELNIQIKNEEIAKLNNLTKMFWLFNFLERNPNKDAIKYYKKQEKERLERVKAQKIRNAKKIKDRTIAKEYDYTQSMQKQNEDKQSKGHNISKRQRKQIEIKEMRTAALRKIHKLLKRLKKRSVKKSVIRAIAIYAQDIIFDSDPNEVMPVIVNLEKDALSIDSIFDISENDGNKMEMYIEYADKLQKAREFGISYKTLLNSEKQKIAEMQKEKEEVI